MALQSSRLQSFHSLQVVILIGVEERSREPAFRYNLFCFVTLICFVTLSGVEGFPKQKKIFALIRARCSDTLTLFGKIQIPGMGFIHCQRRINPECEYDYTNDHCRNNYAIIDLKKVESQ